MASSLTPLTTVPPSFTPLSLPPPPPETSTAFSVLAKCWNTVGTRWGRKDTPSHLFEHLRQLREKSLEKIRQQQPTLLPVIDKLLFLGTQITESVLFAYFNRLPQLIPNCPDFAVLAELSLSLRNKKAAEMTDVLKRYSKHHYIIAPVLVSTWIGKHIAVFLIDTKTPCIEFYDSKGYPVAENTRPLPGGEEPLVALYEEICSLYFPKQEVPFVENRTPHQKDLNNCGLFLLRYVEQRLSGSSATALHAEEITHESIVHYRLWIAKTLLEPFSM